MLDRILKISIVATFFVPLIVIPSSYIFPFIVPKILLFRTFTAVIGGLFILLLLSNWQKYRVRTTPVTIAVTLFLLSFAVSTFVGVDWYRSLWDNHERMLGLFTIFHYTLYYIVLTSVVQEWKDWKWLMRAFLGAGSIVMFIAVLQRYVDQELLLNTVGNTRVSSTLGNPIYLSGYGLFLMFLGMLLATKEQVKKGNVWFWYAVVGGLLGFWGVFLGGTRGALLGLFAGVGVLLFSYLFSLKEHKRVKQGIFGIIILGVCLFGTLFAFRQTDFVRWIPAIGRLVNTTLTNSGTRLMAWEVAVDAWKEKPVFGWGPNNYYYAFNKYYRPEFLNYGWGETWFDNAHSVIMNTLAVQGAFGLIIYLGIYGVAIIFLWKKYKKGDVDAHVVSIGFAFLVAHLVSLSTVFENPTSYIYFFFFIAFLNTQLTPSEYRVQGKYKDISLGSIIVVGLVVLLFVYSTDINPARANTATLKTIKGFSSGQDVVALYAIAKDIPTPHIDDIRNDISRTSEQAISNLFSTHHVAEATNLFQLTYRESKKNLLLHPLDIRIYIQLAKMCIVVAEGTKDPNLLYEAEHYLEQALMYSPKRQQVQYTLAALKVQLQKGDEAIELLQNSIDSNPIIADGWWRLALVLNEMGEIERAKDILKEAQAQGIIFDGQGLQVVNSLLGDE